MASLADRNALALNVGQSTFDQDTATAREKALQAEEPNQDQQLGLFIEAERRKMANVTDAKSHATLVETHIREMGRKAVELHGWTEDLI